MYLNIITYIIMYIYLNVIIIITYIHLNMMYIYLNIIIIIITWI